MANLNSTDWLIVLLSLFGVLSVGFLLRANTKTSKDFLEAGRALPTWVCALAFVAASMGFQELIAMGTAGARYGFGAAMLFWFGAIPALLFAGVAMMPLYYGSGARTMPEYLGRRFDRKTRLLNACTFAVMTLGSAGVSLYLMARLMQWLKIFDPLFYVNGWPHEGIFTFCVSLSAAVVLVYVLLAGLAGAMIGQVLQFLLIVAGFVPVAMMGLKNVGGWSGVKAALPAASPYSATHPGAVSSVFLWVLLGLFFGAGRWCTDFRILQMAMAAKNMESARRVPLLAAALRLLIPFLLILPGAIAIGLPTPHSTTVVRDENGAIYHEITVVPPDEAQGRGLVPARVDAATGKPLLDSAGHTQLNYDRATPEMLVHFLPTGLLGLGLAALLASLMSGLAASLTAFNAVFTVDIYETCLGKNASDSRSPAVGRWAALGGMLIVAGVAYTVLGFSGVGGFVDTGAFSDTLGALLLVFALVIAPQLATFLMGMFSRRATGHGAFAGLAAGTAAAVLHYGLTLPVDARAGVQGGWIAIAHRYPGFIAECFWTATIGFTVNLIVASVVSACTEARPAEQLKGMVYWLTPRPAIGAWWKGPEAMAGAIVLAAILLGFFFA